MNTWRLSDEFKNLTRTSLFKDTCIIKFFTKIRSVFQTSGTNCGKNALSRSAEESLKNFLDPDTDAYEFHNLILSSRRTNRQTNAGHYMNFLANVIITSVGKH